MPFCSLKNEHLQELMHGKIILSPIKKIITNDIRQNEIIDEELLRKANNKFFTPNEFNHALKDLVNRNYALYIHLNISSLSYHHQELYNILSSMKTKPKIIGISESKLQINKQQINNISLPNYVYEHTPTESGKGGTLLYINQNLKYKVRGHLNIYSKFLIESTFIEVMNTKQKI